MTMTQTAPASIKPGLDERVLNSGTGQRFALLLVLFVAEGTGTAYDVAATATGSRELHGIALALAYLVPVALIIAAVGVYRALPRWKGRHGRSVPLSAFPDPNLRSELDGLVEVSGLQPAPQFVVDPGAASVGAVVFGTHRRPVVRLNAGLIVTRAVDPQRFRAVVLHELAHIHNRDVGITYATVAMWRVLLAAVFVPDAVLLATGVSTVSVTAVGSVTVKLLIVLMVYLTRADILRTREIYADRTAVGVWGVRPESLLPRDRVDSTGRLAVVLAVWRTHPSWPLRRRSLSTPDELFAMRAMPMVITGIAAAVAAARLTAPFDPIGAWGGVVQFLLIAGLAVGIGGVVLWRTVVHAAVTGRAVPSGWRAGLWLGLGLAVGELTNTGIIVGRPVIIVAALLAGLISVTALIMAWTAQFAELRIKTYRGESLNLAMLTGLIPPGLVLAFTLRWWNTGTWWDFSVQDQLSAAQLPAADVPWLVPVAAALTALPGSDPGLTGLWWSVPLLWLIPLQLWLVRLPRRVPRPTRATRVPRLTAARLRLPEWLCALAWLVVVLAVLCAGFTGIMLLVSAGPAGIFGLVLLGFLTAQQLWRRAKSNEPDARLWFDGEDSSIMVGLGLRKAVRIGGWTGLLCIPLLLAEPLVAGSVSYEPRWHVASLANLAWIVLSITAVMLVAGFVAGMTRSRYPVITAPTAAGIAGVAGISAQYLKSTVDGCLGSFNVMTTQCSWQPVRYIPFAEYALGYVLAPGLLMAVLLAVGTHTLRRHRHRQDIQRPVKPMVAGRLFNAIAVCLIGCTTVYHSLIMEGPLPRSNLLIAYQVSPTGHVATGVSPLADWMRFTADVLRGYGSSLSDLSDVLDTLGNSETENVLIVRSDVPPICGELSDIDQNALQDSRLYNPAPPPELERLWVRFLDAEAEVTANCWDLARARTDATIDNGFVAITSAADSALPIAKALVD